MRTEGNGDRPAGVAIAASMVPRSGVDTLIQRTASPSEPRGTATAVTSGAGLAAAAVACCVEAVCVRETGNSWVGAAAASSAAPATRRRYGRTFLCYVDPKRVFRIHEDVFDEEVACQDSLDIQRLPSLWAASPFCSAASPSPLNRLPHVLRLCCWAQETPVLRPTDQARQPQSS